jgi:hypothetical protein
MTTPPKGLFLNHRWAVLQEKGDHVNPSAAVRTGVYLFVSTVLMTIVLPGALFAGQTETTPSESIQTTDAGPGNGETPLVPDMFLKNSEYDVGEVYEGTPVTHTFIITNRGKGDLVLQSVKPG